MALIDWTEHHGDRFRDHRVLVTGGAGFIGSHLAQALLELGARVTVVDDLSGGEVANLDGFREAAGDRLRFVEGSIADADLMADLCRDQRYVFHQAALGSVPRSIEQPDRYFRINVAGTHNLLESARAAGVQRLVFAASSSAYGDSPTLPKTESMPVRPKSPYAANKVACETMIRAWANCYDLDAASLRYFNIFGPRQNANSAYAAVIAAFAKALNADEKPVIFGDGEQSRDFTFVDNAVHANLLAAACDHPLRGEVMNVACGQRVTVNQLALAMARFWDKPHLSPQHRPERAGDVKHSLADLSLAREMIGYEPMVDFQTGLEATCRWYQSVPV